MFNCNVLHHLDTQSWNETNIYMSVQTQPYLATIQAEHIPSQLQLFMKAAPRTLYTYMSNCKHHLDLPRSSSILSQSNSHLSCISVQFWPGKFERCCPLSLKYIWWAIRRYSFPDEREMKRWRKYHFKASMLKANLIHIKFPPARKESFQYSANASVRENTVSHLTFYQKYEARGGSYCGFKWSL